MKFSIIIVCLNPGDKIYKTARSVLNQSYTDFELIIKDGNSTDGAADTLGLLRPDKRMHIYHQPDTGIYDAMNQAIQLAQGEYLLFLNCGDALYHNDILQEVADFIAGDKGQSKLYYGDTFCEQTKKTDSSVPEITGFACYRNIPCHQSCFYQRSLFDEKQYDTQMKIRADYDHFLWCYYVKKVTPKYMYITVSSYEGGGFSESKANRKRDAKEHKLITRRYMSKIELFRYKAIMALSLVHIRRWVANSKMLSGAYYKIKEKVYHR